jgi:acyl-CoA reductase-like NAD-dependent aldehyde dehydrogenase
MKGHWIDNQWMEGDSKEFIEVRNPATEEILDRVSSGSEQDAKHAVESAKAAFEIWRKTPAIERAAMLHEASAKMRTHWNELVELLTLEEGKPVSENEEEMEWVAGTFDYYAELGRHYRGRVLPSPEPDAALIVLEGCTCSGCRKHGGDQTIRDDPPLHLAVSRKML